MQYNIYISILLTIFLSQSLLGQTETYTVTKALFSSDKYDEFCPVYYKNGIVFSTNRSRNSIAAYSGPEDKGQFKIYYTDTTGKVTWQQSELFSKDLSTRLNDGPVTFNPTGDTIYFSRNLLVEGSLKELAGPRNKLGIFSANFDGKKWSKIREFRFNNEWYNVTTPYLSKDGKKLFFASDKPGGYGGFDLYYSEWKNGYWDNAVNLGPVINTEGNEVYPYLNISGGLFFSSDGHRGMGGKDIFFSRTKDNVWQTPVRLDPPVNSTLDDFGIVTDDMMNEGFFSTKRESTADIYRFKTITRQLFYSNKHRENQYCFVFSDESNIVTDNNMFQYEWDFGDGIKAPGQSVVHCYTGPGSYDVRLNITDKRTGRLFFNKISYSIELKDIEQPYIDSPEASVTGETVSMNGSKSYFPGYEILDYIWDFGDGSRDKGPKISHVFKLRGDYEIRLGVVIKEVKTGIIRQETISKPFSVFDNEKERDAFLAKLNGTLDRINIKDYDHAIIRTRYSADEDLKKDAVYVVEIVNSKIELGLNDIVFRKVPSKYKVRELYNESDNTYSYVVDSKINLVETWLTFTEMKSSGFSNTVIRTFILTDPAEKELYNLKKIYGLSSDIYFDNYNRLTSTSYLFLEQVSRLLIKYPEIKLEIEVHTDNLAQSQVSQMLSQQRAQLMVSYLVNKGIDIKRLLAKGMGGVFPVASNSTEAERKLNRRVDINILR